MQQSFEWNESSRFLLECLGIATSVLVVVLSLTKSLVISLPFSLFALLLWRIRFHNRQKRRQEELRSAWPEALDQIISGIHGGESLAQTLIRLESRGPAVLRPYFSGFATDLRNGADFSEALYLLKSNLASPVSDQICEAVILAKSLGGGELLVTLRSLRDFVRTELQLRKEIAVKQGWVKNSAYLSAAAPWLLLLLLSSQPGTVESFSEPAGILILASGVGLTLLAFMWMSFLGRMSEGVRVFSK